MKLFKRKLRLIIQEATGAGLDLGSLACRFDVERVANSINRAKITVWNLSDTTLGLLTGRHRLVRLEVGYDDTLSTLFQGGIKNVFTTQEGPDRITEIFASDGGRDYSGSMVALSFSDGTDLHAIIQAVVASFTDVQMGSLRSVTNRSTFGARSEFGRTSWILDGLARSFGFNWSIQNGIFVAYDKGETSTAQIVTLSRETGMVGTPVASTTGLEVLTLINPEIRPGGLVNVVTAGARVAASIVTLATAAAQPVPVAPPLAPTGPLSPNLRMVGQQGGVFSVYRVTHVGETRGQPWYSRVDCVPKGRQTVAG